MVENTPDGSREPLARFFDSAKAYVAKRWGRLLSAGAASALVFLGVDPLTLSLAALSAITLLVVLNMPTQKRTRTVRSFNAYVNYISSAAAITALSLYALSNLNTNTLSDLLPHLASADSVLSPEITIAAITGIMLASSLLELYRVAQLPEGTNIIDQASHKRKLGITVATNLLACSSIMLTFEGIDPEIAAIGLLATMLTKLFAHGINQLYSEYALEAAADRLSAFGRSSELPIADSYMAALGSSNTATVHHTDAQPGQYEHTGGGGPRSSADFSQGDPAEAAPLLTEGADTTEERRSENSL